MSTSGAAVTRYVPVARRADLDPDRFDRYWADVHGPLCAGLPSLYPHVQHHLDAPRAQLWVAPPGVSTDVPAAEIVDGVADCGFATGADFDDWLGHAQVLMNDEQNCFAATFGYYSSTDEVRGSLAGEGRWTTIALLRRTAGPADGFAALVAELAAAFGAGPRVTGVRTHVFDPYEDREQAWQATNVDHARSAPVLHHAALEITVEDPDALEEVFGSPAYLRTLPEQGRLLAAVHAYPVRYTAVFVADGQPTLTGLRGHSVTQLITEVGAKPPAAWR